MDCSLTYPPPQKALEKLHMVLLQTGLNRALKAVLHVVAGIVIAQLLYVKPEYSSPFSSSDISYSFPFLLFLFGIVKTLKI